MEKTRTIQNEDKGLIVNTQNPSGIVITGHRRNIGKSLYEYFPDSVGLSRTTGMNINEPKEVIDFLPKNTKVFINNAHEKFAQTELLFELCSSGFTGHIINIGSTATERLKRGQHTKDFWYGVSKMSLYHANDIMFYHGYNTTYCGLCNINVGAGGLNGLDVSHVPPLIEYIINAPFRIKEISIGESS